MTTKIAAGVGLANSLVFTFFDTHPFLTKVLSVIGLAILSTLTAELTKRFFPRKK
jgi:hypothetical protein